jgi:hypothetical protein
LAQHNALPEENEEVNYYYKLTVDSLIAKGSPISSSDSQKANIVNNTIKLFPKEPLINIYFNEFCGTYSTTKGQWDSQDWYFKNTTLENYGSGKTKYNAYAKQSPYSIRILENN